MKSANCLTNVLLLTIVLSTLGHTKMLTNDINNFLQSVNQDEKQQEQALKKLRTEIHSNLLNAKNSAEKSRLRSEISSELESIKPLLIQTAISNNEKLKAPSVNIIRYTQFNDQIIDVLQNITLDRSFDLNQGYIISEAVLALSEKGYLNKDVESVMIDRLSESLDDGSGRFEDLAFTIGHAQISGAVPILIKGLLSSDNHIMLAAAKSLQQLRASAYEALPTLREVLQKYKADKNVNYREIEALEFAILAISNQAPNAISRVETTTPKFADSNSQVIAGKNPSIISEKPIQSVLAQPSPSAPVWPWAVGLLLLAVMGGVWWKFLRK
jgi:hypothetical protein